MKVLMINNGYDGCCYVRIMLPAFHNGFSMDKTSLDSDRKSPKIMERELKWADIIVFHRPEKKEYHDLADMLKRDGKKVVMDNDDTFKIEDNHPLAEFKPNGKYAETLNKRIKSIDDFIIKSDLITTSTEFLAKEYRKIKDNVVVLPNCVDPMDWEEPLRNETDKIRIGIVGSSAYEYDYLHLKSLLKKLGDRKDIELVLFGLGDKKHRKENPKVTKAFSDEYKFWDSIINKKHIAWCPVSQYPAKLNEARLDMMLIPRKDNYFNRCKSNIKFLEASMLEIPVIAQSFDDSPYEEITPNMGILIRDNSKWEEEIERLILNKNLRRMMGENAKKYTLKKYNIEDRYHLWADAYSKIL